MVSTRFTVSDKTDIMEDPSVKLFFMDCNSFEILPLIKSFNEVMLVCKVEMEIWFTFVLTTFIN